MNNYLYNQLQIGHTESFSVTITDEMMSDFLRISGDNNPLHIDELYAESKGFKSKVVYGLLTASFYSKLAGVYLPGRYCLLQGVDAKFNKPVFVNDTLNVTGVVVQKNDNFKLLVIKATIINQVNITVSTAVIKASFLNED